MGEVFLDAFIDSLIVLAFLVPINVIIAIAEPHLAGKIKLKGKAAPLVGVTVGLFPQCGFSVVATDLYQKRHITVGTLLGVYLATSDEALPIFLAAGEQAIDILPILAFKFVIGLLAGYTADLLYARGRRRVEEHNAKCDHEPEVHIGCCGHHIEEDEEKSGHDHSECGEPCGEEKELDAKNKRQKLKQYLLHPLEHSAKIFLYIFVVNVIFGIIIYCVGEDSLMEFLSSNRYIVPQPQSVERKPRDIRHDVRRINRLCLHYFGNILFRDVGSCIRRRMAYDRKDQWWENRDILSLSAGSIPIKSNSPANSSADFLQKSDVSYSLYFSMNSLLPPNAENSLFTLFF